MGVTALDGASERRYASKKNDKESRLDVVTTALSYNTNGEMDLLRV